MYPCPETLRRARALGVPLVISSDAHAAGHVGRIWDEAIALARTAGYREDAAHLRPHAGAAARPRLRTRGDRGRRQGGHLPQIDWNCIVLR